MRRASIGSATLLIVLGAVRAENPGIVAARQRFERSPLRRVSGAGQRLSS